MAKFLRSIVRYGPCVLLLIAPAWSQTPGPPRPGSINYLEGQASIGAMALTPGSVGSVVLETGQTLATQAGKGGDPPHARCFPSSGRQQLGEDGIARLGEHSNPVG